MIEHDELAGQMSRLRKLCCCDGGDSYKFGSYHNHTTWSDGAYAPDELVQKALVLEFQELGITDHAYTEKGAINCVHDEQLPAYREMLDQLRGKYRDRIRILSGIEVDTSQCNPNRLSLPVGELQLLDYVLFEYVGETAWGGYTIAELLHTRNRLDCSVGLAHPNMQLLIKEVGAKELGRILGENDIFIDACGSARNSRPIPYERPQVSRSFTLNIEGMDKEFKDAALEYGVRFLPSSDTHCDDERDELSAAVNAILTMARYGFSQKSFEE